MGTQGFQYIGLDNVSVRETRPFQMQEPASMVLIGSGLIVMAARLRARRAAGR